MKRKAHLFAALVVALTAAPLAAQNGPRASAPPPPPVPPPPPAVMPPPPVPPIVPLTSANTRVLYAVHCGAEAIAFTYPAVPEFKRVAFASTGQGPARVIFCADDYEEALPVPITAIDMALTFMSYQPFAPFWPAAEARWGSDMGSLREEVRARPLEDAIAAYPYATSMDLRTATVFGASRTASAAGDWDKARDLAAAELERLGALSAKTKGEADVGFEMSLLIGRLGNLAAQRNGPAAGADLIADLLARYPVEEDYRANPDTNRAALLAEAGRAKEALRIITPLLGGFSPEDAGGAPYSIPGSIREFAWIMACALKSEKGADAAAPYARLVTSFSSEPVDPYVGWTKSNGEIRLRMYKCFGDTAGFVETLRATPPGILSGSWLELQEHVRPMVGHTLLPGLIAEAQAAGLAADYRQLPESYRPALRSWLAPQAGE